MQRTFIWPSFFTFENFASRATDATRRDKAWDRAGKLRLVMRNRTILVAVLISPYLSQKVAESGVRVSAGSTLRCVEQKWLSEIKSVNLHFFFKIVTVSLFRVIFDAEKR